MKNKKRFISLLLIMAVLVTSFSTYTTPISAADTEPVLTNGDFEEEINPDDIQLYKAQRVDATTGKVKTGSHAIKVGSEKPTEDKDYPLWFFNGGKGSANIIIRNVQPNTKYRVSMSLYNETGVNMRIGVLDIEGSRVPFRRGQLKSESRNHWFQTSNWQEAKIDIVTGPRSKELYAFALTNWTNTEQGAGVFYIDDVKVEKLEEVPSSVTSTVQYTPKDTAEFPQTIPAIQEFTASDQGQFNLDKTLQAIFVDEANYDKAEYFGEKLVEKGLVEKYEIFDISEKGKSGIAIENSDLKFNYPADHEGTRHEAYEMDIENQLISLNAESTSGIQNGLMTLLQAFTQQDFLPNGTVNDYTDQEIRGLQVDTGRRYYSIGWLENQIEQMAYQKLNKLQLRLKDNEGLRYESEVAPQFIDTAGGYWTREEVKHLVNYARQFDIEIIPEVDFPGHSEQDGVYFDDSWALKSGSRTLNFALPEVREYMLSLYKEAFELFEADTVHIGGDEYFQTAGYEDPEGKLTAWAVAESGDPSANEYDALKIYFNEMAAPFLEEGKRVLVWNDNIKDVGTSAVTLDDRIVIDFWAGTFYNSISASDTLNKGYQTMGSAANLYHDLWPENDKLDRPLPEWFYSQWNRFTYSTGYGQEQVSETNLSLGQMFPIWDDAHGYVPEYILTQTLYPRLNIFADMMWGSSTNTKNYAEFERLGYQIGTVKQEGFSQIELIYNENDYDLVATAISDELATMDLAVYNSEKIDALKDLVAAPANPGNYSSSIYQLIHAFENLNAETPTYESVSVHYHDESGKEIHEPLELNRDDTSRYSVEPIEIDGYEYVSVARGNDVVSGFFDDERHEIKFTYKLKKSTEPGGETPGGETPGGETPGGETPGGETPGGETPGGETPGGETPGGTKPGGTKPGSETPGVDQPKDGKDLPGTGVTPNNIALVGGILILVGTTMYLIKTKKEKHNN
ncbi:family 20 glycosylhydrolase [Erysipelothrix tonsillarum]|uniref:family 20 glycosylhydrolase n=1 Tax=Erysipelothrix tonsillarum TaxID=38402 RepID=UPI0003A71B0C|nr:family 20 glycosylhydrolase [Erysipelothrix tonsillarum]